MFTKNDIIVLRSAGISVKFPDKEELSPRYRGKRMRAVIEFYYPHLSQGEKRMDDVVTINGIELEGSDRRLVLQRYNRRHPKPRVYRFE